MYCGRVAELLVCSLFSLGWSAVAQGEDPPTESPYAAAKKAYEAARKAKSDEVVELLPKLAAAAAQGKNEEEIKDALLVLNRPLTYGTEAMQVVALEGFGVLAKPTSSQYLRPFVQGDKAGKRPLAVRKAALEAWARIHDPGTNEVLLDQLFRFSSKDDDREMALQAAKQYKHYKNVPKKQRFGVVRDFYQAYERIYTQTTLFTSADARGWWGLLSTPLLTTFNELTGQKLGSYEKVVEWWLDHKDELAAQRE